MKRLLLLTIICTSAFSACTKDDGGGSAGGKNIKIEVLDLNGDFRHIKVDSAYVYNFESHFQEAICDKDGIEMPQVDFSSSALIAVTGVSPTLAENISPRLVKTGSGYVLNIDVKCSESEYVKPRKWSLLLKAPASVDPSMKCNITYDKTFDTQQMPDYSYFYATYKDGTYHTMLEKVPIMDDAYLVTMLTSDLDKLKASVNADDKCVLMLDIPPHYSHPTGLLTEYLAPVSPADCTCALLKNCDYEKVLSPLENDILYLARGGYNGATPDFSQCYLFYMPAYQASISINKEFAESMAKNLGIALTFSSSEDSLIAYFKFDKNSKINSLQLAYLLCEENYLKPSIFYSLHYPASKPAFDMAVKQVYE